MKRRFLNKYTNFMCIEMTKIKISFSHHLCHSGNVLPILTAVRSTSLSAYLVNMSCSMRIYDIMTRYLKVKGENSACHKCIFSSLHRGFSSLSDLLSPALLCCVVLFKTCEIRYSVNILFEKLNC